MEPDDRLTHGHRGTGRAERNTRRRPQSQEEENAEEFPQGQGVYLPNNRGLFIWNFGFADHVLKPEHERILDRWMRSRIFSAMVHYRIPIAVMGRASRSGENELNLRLSRDRAQSTINFMRVHPRAQPQARYGEGFNPGTLFHNVALGENARLRAIQEYIRTGNTSHDAINRSVTVFQFQCNQRPLTLHEITEIARTYLASRLRRALPPVDRLWTPQSVLIDQMIPRPIAPFGDTNPVYWGIHVPPVDLQCGNVPGYQCLEKYNRSAEVLFVKHILFLDHCTRQDVTDTLDRFISAGQQAFSRQEERIRLLWAASEGGGGGGAVREQAERYAAFSRRYFIEDPTCLWHYL